MTDDGSAGVGTGQRREVAASYTALTTAVLASGISPLLVRSIGASSLAIATYRAILSVPIGLIAARLSNGRVDRYILRRSFVGGTLLGIAAMLGFWALHETSVANVMVIISMQPIIVAVLAIVLLHERPSRRQIALGAIALIGVLVLVTDHQAPAASRFGDVLAVMNVVCFSVYLIVMKRATNEGVPADRYMAGVFITSAIVTLPTALLLQVDFGSPRGVDWLTIVVVSFTSTYAGHGLIAKAQRHVTITVTSIASLASAVLAIAGVWILFDEHLSRFQMVAGIAAVGALVAVLLDQFKRSAWLTAEQPSVSASRLIVEPVDRA